MYEFQLANKVNNAIQDICSRFNFRKVTRILLKAGAMRKINPELTAFIFSSISEGTPAEGAIFSVMFVPTTFRCHSCGQMWTTESADFMCAFCGSRDVDLLTGLELSIDFVEVEG